jgi:hypothetical protein
MRRRTAIGWFVDDIEKRSAKRLGNSRKAAVDRLCDKLATKGYDKLDIDISGWQLPSDGACGLQQKLTPEQTAKEIERLLAFRPPPRTA